MKLRVKNLFLLCALITGLGVMPARRATAQNYADWPVTQVAAGGYHTLFTRADGTVFVMGDNTYGQLGLGPTITNVNVPTALTNGVGLIAAGYGHSLMVRGHALWAMGDNNHGQLGDGTTNNHYVPEQVYSAGIGINAGSINALSAGGFHSLFAVLDRSFSGGLWTMGDNEYGQLGDGTDIDHLTPEEILSFSTGLPSISAVAAGGYHSLFSKSDGSLWSMGDNYNGQLGNPNITTSTNSPVLVQFSPDPAWGPATVVEAGEYDSFFITTNGYLWAMGDNGDGELGMPFPKLPYEDVNYPWPTAGRDVGYYYSTSDLAVVATAAGANHSLFILSDGSLWDMGNNSSGQLGVGFAGYSTDLPQEVVTSNILAVAAGDSYSIFIKSDGSLWGMGFNANGQLGTGDYAERDTPVEIVAPPPQINIVPYGSNVILAWPANAVAFVLQSTTSLTSPKWTTVTPGPVIVGDECEEVHPVSAPQLYYRLVLNP